MYNIITFFNEAKGYGFIKDSVSQDSVFLHINATSEAVKENMKVTFEGLVFHSFSYTSITVNYKIHSFKMGKVTYFSAQ